MDLHEHTFRAFVEGDVSTTERELAEAHLNECGDCREFVDFVRDVSEGIKEVAEEAIRDDDSCPSAPTIVAYAEGQLDPESAFHLRTHMLFCDRCAESYYLLKRLRANSWTEIAIDAIRSATGMLFRQVQIAGMGELVASPVTVSRGEPEKGQSQVEIRQHADAADEEADLLWRITGEPQSGMHIGLRIDPPRPAWTALLRDARETEIASVPLSQEHVDLGVLPEATYIAQVLAADAVVAECRIHLRTS